MIPGMPDIPGLNRLPPSFVDAAIGFGGAFAINMVFGNQWGIYSQYGVPILLADTVYSVKYQNSSQIAQAPVEKGTFTSYNKVQDPYKATVALAKGGGNPAERGAFIAQLEALSRSTIQYHVVTPEFVHRNASITGYDYARDPQAGARMIVANIHLEEVRESGVEYDTVETRNPADSAILSAGEVQTSPVDSSILNRIVSSGALSTVWDNVKNAAAGAFQ